MISAEELRKQKDQGFVQQELNKIETMIVRANKAGLTQVCIAENVDILPKDATTLMHPAVLEELQNSGYIVEGVKVGADTLEISSKIERIGKGARSVETGKRVRHTNVIVRW